jgi:hypothetical protein
MAISKGCEIKDCPFCHSIVTIDPITMHGGHQHFFPSCCNEQCIAYVDDPHLTFDTPQKAADAWNVRAGEQSAG